MQIPPKFDLENLKQYPAFKAIFWSVLVFASIAALVIVGWFNLRSSIEQEQKLLFAQITTSVEKRISDRLDALVDFLYGARALFASSESVERGEWQQFVQILNLSNRFGEGIGVFYTEKVIKKDLEKFIESVKSDTSLSPAGFPDFKVHPFVNKEEYYITKYIEPLKGREAGLGFESGSDPERLAAILKTRDTSDPAAAHITISPTTGEPTIPLYLAIYKNNVPQYTIQERRVAFQGVVVMGIRINSFFKNLFNDIAPSINIEIFDGNVTNKDHLIYDSDTSDNGIYSGDKKDILIEKLPVNFANHLWTVVIYMPKNFSTDFADRIASSVVLIGGGILALLFAFLTNLILMARSKAITLALQLSEESRQDKQRFEDMIYQSQDPIIILNNLGILEFVNPATEKISGYSKSEFIGKHFTETGIVMPEELSKIKENFSNILKGGIVNPFEIRMKNNGKEIVVEANPSLMGRNKVVIFFRNITERKVLEEELQKKNEELSKINKLLIGRELKMSELKKQLAEKEKNP